MSSLVNALRAQGKETSIAQSVIGAIKSTYDAVSPYNNFEGNTKSENEGRWLGYKHGVTGVGIYMAYGIGFLLFQDRN